MLGRASALFAINPAPRRTGPCETPGRLWPGGGGAASLRIDSQEGLLPLFLPFPSTAPLSRVHTPPSQQ
jgi:hypothetical protein